VGEGTDVMGKPFDDDERWTDTWHQNRMFAAWTASRHTVRSIWEVSTDCRASPNRCCLPLEGLACVAGRWSVKLFDNELANHGPTAVSRINPT